MRTRRAFTLIEVVFAMLFTAMVLGAVTSLYAFATVRLSDAYTQSSLYDQLNGMADRMESVLRNAKTAASADSGATLNVTMPLNGIDTDGDGVNDAWYPNKSDSTGNATQDAGGHVWFYNAGLTGAFKSGSGYIWVAETASSATPTSSNTDKAFCLYYGGKQKFPLVTGLSFTVNSVAHFVTFTLTGSTQIGSEQSASSVDTSARSASVTRTVSWRNWR